MYTCIQTAIQKPHGNHKTKIYNYVQNKEESKHNAKYSHIITKEERG